MKRTVVPIFTGTVSDDGSRIEFAADEASQRRRYLQTLAGQRIEVVVRKRKTKRSLDQNAFWHSVPFPLLAEYLGYDEDEIEELKFFLMGEYSGWHESKAGLRLPNILHTSDLTTEEGADFTEWLVRFGAKLPGGGVMIPLPNEAQVA